MTKRKKQNFTMLIERLMRGIQTIGEGKTNITHRTFRQLKGELTTPNERQKFDEMLWKIIRGIETCLVLDGYEQYLDETRLSVLVKKIYEQVGMKGESSAFVRVNVFLEKEHIIQVMKRFATVEKESLRQFVDIELSREYIDDRLCNYIESKITIHNQRLAHAYYRTEVALVSCTLAPIGRGNTFSLYAQEDPRTRLNNFPQENTYAPCLSEYRPNCLNGLEFDYIQ